MARIAIIGTTTWGTTLGIINARENREVVLLARTSSEASELQTENENRRFLPGVPFPKTMNITSSPKDAIENSDLIIFAVPAASMRENSSQLSSAISCEKIAISATKGQEPKTGKRMTSVLLEELDLTGNRICVMSGPNLAKEILAGKPSSTVIASTDRTTATYAQTHLNSSNLRVYTNRDVIGVELAGALKNVVAIAAGISDGLGFGDNAKASIITRGLAEISRLGVSLGADPATFAGLAGMGDVIATCSSNLSRNNSLGRMLASGMSLNDITSSMENIAEGIGTTQEIVQMAKPMNLDIPLTKSVYSVLFDGVAPLEAVANLMGRSPTSEI